MRIGSAAQHTRWPSEVVYDAASLHRLAERHDRRRHGDAAPGSRGLATGALAARVLAQPALAPPGWLLGTRGAGSQASGALARGASLLGGSVGALFGERAAGRRWAVGISDLMLELPRLVLESGRYAVSLLGAAVGFLLGRILPRRTHAEPELLFPLHARAVLMDPRSSRQFAPTLVSKALKQLRVPCPSHFDSKHVAQDWLSRLAVGQLPPQEAGYNHALGRAASQVPRVQRPAPVAPLTACNHDDDVGNPWPGMGLGEVDGEGHQGLGRCRGVPTPDGRIGVALQYASENAEVSTLDFVSQVEHSLRALRRPHDVAQVRAALKAAMRLDWFEHLPDADPQASPIMATVAVQQPNHLHVGHVGLNRALLCTPRGPVRLTVDHTLGEGSERKRAESAPAAVRAAGLSRGLLPYTPNDGVASRAQVTTLELAQVPPSSALVLLPEVVAGVLSDDEVNAFVQSQLGPFSEDSVAHALAHSAQQRDGNQSANYGALVWRLDAGRAALGD